ncbi:hypothetical protein ES707_10077 [subsurface metagenome]
MARINWGAVVTQAVEQAQAYYNEYKEAGTLRAIYYRLVSIEVLPNTKSAYKGLSRALTDARLEGTFPWHLMIDNVRASTGERSKTTLETAKYWASTETRDKLAELESAFEAIADPHVNFVPAKWSAQKKRVILAIEKDAILGAVRSVTSRQDVEIFPLRGYSSTTFVKQLADRIRSLHQLKDREDPRCGEVHLLIITDYDPSGEDIARDVQDRLRYKFGVTCVAEKILLTKPQITEYDLPARPEDADEIAKMQRDPRWNKWTDGVFRVELDAMAAIEPDAFRKIIQDAISKHFDKDLSTSQRKEAKEACKEAEEELRELYGKLEEVHKTVSLRIEEIRAQEEED